jgi:hypothetical protein
VTTKRIAQPTFNVRFTRAELVSLIEAIRSTDLVLAARLAQQVRNTEYWTAQDARRKEKA